MCPMETTLFHIDLAGVGMILGLTAILAGIFVGLPLKLKLERLDRVIAEKEAKMREEERAARPSA
jgi:hypothetical protein